MQTRTLAATVILASLAASAMATEILPPGAIACISQKDAKTYAKYVAEAPDFATDMLARATCYVNKDEAEVVATGKSGNFVQYKLLTGHKIWVAKDTVHTAKPAAAAK